MQVSSTRITWARASMFAMALSCGVMASHVAAAADTILFVDDDAPPGGDGLTWETAYRFLADALTTARKRGGDATEIRVAQGTYLPDRSEQFPRGSGDRDTSFDVVDEVPLIGGFAGFGAENPDARDFVKFETIISGDLLGNDGTDFTNYEDNSERLFYAESTDVVIDGFTVRACSVEQFAGSPLDARLAVASVANCLFTENLVRDGVILSEQASISVVDCRFVRNKTTGSGGVINVYSWITALTFDRCEFTDNQAENDGGAIDVSYEAEGPITLTDCVFAGNTAESWGGAIDTEHPITLTGCTFITNTAERGGAINDAAAFVGGVTLIDCSFVENTATSGSGGAIASDGGLIARNTIFSGNSTLAGDGGAVYDEGEWRGAQFEDCIFSGNIAGTDRRSGSGGGYLSFAFTDDTVASFRRCTFELNRAVETGGAIFTYQDTTIDQCTFIANSVAELGGGAVYDAGPTVITNSVFARNKAPYAGAVASAHHSVIANCAFFGNEGYVYGGGGVVAAAMAEPLLFNNVFVGNKASSAFGGAIASWRDANPLILNCTIVANTAETGGGLFVGDPFKDPDDSSSATVVNSVFWDNVDSTGETEAAQIFLQRGLGDAATVDYSCVEGLTGTLGGIGNIDADPLFVDPFGDDGVLGNEDDDLRLSTGSPCIDAAFNNAVPADVADLDDDGDLTEFVPFDLDGEPRFADDARTEDTGCGAPAIVDMGAYEFPGIAIQPVRGDITGDLLVGSADLIELLSSWGECPAEDDDEIACCAADLNADGLVDGGDLLILLGNWS